MKRVSLFLLFFIIISCGRRQEKGLEYISVSIAPFKYFVKEISDNRFEVNTNKSTALASAFPVLKATWGGKPLNVFLKIPGIFGPILT